ncbi:hypothetical protein RA28_01605 [Ruegeria sp. ANG-S4]|nr:hypothetical protein RA28_01605 [Ruegeria sp. ANG-S4]
MDGLVCFDQPVSYPVRTRALRSAGTEQPAKQPHDYPAAFGMGAAKGTYRCGVGRHFDHGSHPFSSALFDFHSVCDLSNYQTNELSADFS